MNPLGAEILTDRVFSAFSYLDSGRTLVASNATHATVVPASITLGVYTARWSAVASNGNASVNIVALSNGTPQTFTVVDDDTTAPSMVSIYSPESGASRRMRRAGIPTPDQLATPPRCRVPTALRTLNPLAREIGIPPQAYDDS